MNLRVASLPRSFAQSDAFELVGLLKLRLNSLVLFAVGAAHAAAGAEFRLGPLLATLFGSLAAAGGSSAINQAMEASLDRRMERTKDRPCAAGRVRPSDAKAFGALLSVLGVLTVACFAGWTPAALVLATVLLYVFAYTPLKTRTTLNTLVGAIPGALPALVGWTSAGTPFSPLAWSLFGIVFAWQFPHFLAIASIHRDDYARAGFVMLPVVDSTGVRTAIHAIAFALVFLPIALLPGLFRAAGPLYLAGTTVLGVGYLLFTLRAAVLRTRQAWRHVLFASLVVLPGVFVLLMVDRVTV